MLHHRASDEYLFASFTDQIEIIRVRRTIADQIKAAIIKNPKTAELLPVKRRQSHQFSLSLDLEDPKSSAGAVAPPPGFNPFPREKNCLAGTLSKQATPVTPQGVKSQFVI